MRGDGGMGEDGGAEVRTKGREVWGSRWLQLLLLRPSIWRGTGRGRRRRGGGLHVIGPGSRPPAVVAEHTAVSL